MKLLHGTRYCFIIVRLQFRGDSTDFHGHVSLQKHAINTFWCHNCHTAARFATARASFSSHLLQEGASKLLAGKNYGPSGRLSRYRHLHLHQLHCSASECCSSTRTYIRTCSYAKIMKKYLNQRQSQSQSQNQSQSQRNQWKKLSWRTG